MASRKRWRRIQKRPQQQARTIRPSWARMPLRTASPRIDAVPVALPLQDVSLFDPGAQRGKGRQALETSPRPAALEDHEELGRAAAEGAQELLPESLDVRVLDVVEEVEVVEEAARLAQPEEEKGLDPAFGGVQDLHCATALHAPREVSDERLNPPLLVGDPLRLGGLHPLEAEDDGQEDQPAQDRGRGSVALLNLKMIDPGGRQGNGKAHQRVQGILPAFALDPVMDGARSD